MTWCIRRDMFYVISLVIFFFFFFFFFQAEDGIRDVAVTGLQTCALPIFGGNSGSPILNGRGEQVGIVFDGNYEGLGNDFFYNDAKGRTISVDIRYVLFITDKFGGAG